MCGVNKRYIDTRIMCYDASLAVSVMELEMSMSMSQVNVNQSWPI